MTKGRNQALIARRDQALCRRYHYWTEIQRLRFDDALKILSEQEFFLSEERILNILRKNSQSPEGISARPAPKIRKPRLSRANRQILSDRR